MHSILSRSVTHAMARDKVRRNVVTLCAVPTGQAGRPSKSLTLDQAHALLTAAGGSPLHAYIVVSLPPGARSRRIGAPIACGWSPRTTTRPRRASTNAWPAALPPRPPGH